MHFEDNFFRRMYIWEPIYISRNGIILIQSEYQSFSQNDESFHSHVELEQTWILDGGGLSSGALVS